jgi:hypothetical protein
MLEKTIAQIEGEIPQARPVQGLEEDVRLPLQAELAARVRYEPQSGSSTRGSTRSPNGATRVR